MSRHIDRRQFNRHQQFPRRREPRRRQTPAERTLWRHLRDRRSLGLNFNRQYGGPFIVDFYCPEKLLSIELDGAHHFTPAGMAHDAARGEYIRRLGIAELRFENIEVLEQIDRVPTVIERIIAAQPGSRSRRVSAF